MELPEKFSVNYFQISSVSKKGKIKKPIVFKSLPFRFLLPNTIDNQCKMFLFSSLDRKILYIKWRETEKYALIYGGCLAAIGAQTFPEDRILCRETVLLVWAGFGGY